MSRSNASRKRRAEADAEVEEQAELLHKNTENVNAIFKCSITGELPTDPVTAVDGNVYARSEIEKWFEECRKAGRPLTSPITREQMAPTLPVACVRLRIGHSRRQAQARLARQLVHEPNRML